MGTRRAHQRHTAPAATLVEVLAIADGINHSVLAEAEFTNAIGRLAAAGLVEADAGTDRYQPTDVGAALRKPWRHGAFGWIQAIPPQLGKIGVPQDAVWCLPSGIFDRAVQEYLARMTEITKSNRSR
jgi:hypothetical protein